MQRPWFVLLLTAAVLGTSLAAQADAPDSLKILREAVQQSPKDGAAWARLGWAYWASDSLGAAQNAFRKGIKYAKAAGAYHGLALVYIKRSRQRKGAIYAIRVEPNLKKAIKRDPTYAPAYLTLAEWYRDRGYEDRMIDLFNRYLALRPDDLDGRYGLARTYAELRRYGRVLELARPALKSHPDDYRWLPVVAQAYAAQGETDRALALFERYLDLIPPEERAFYEDLSLVAFPEELEVYRGLPEDAREAFLESFWRRRDLTLVSGGKARRAEHYRRVWYARTYFSERVQPWDRRGEIYVRYGEPDYRSRSDRVNPPPGAAVTLIKQRNAHNIYEVGSRVTLVQRPLDGVGANVPVGVAASGNVVDIGGGEEGAGEMGMTPLLQAKRPEPFSWSWTEVRGGMEYWRKPPDVEDERWQEPVFPIDRWADGTTRVPWESWVYTRVGGGIEFVFVDQAGSGRWNFPAMPPEVLNPGLISRAVTYNPGFVFQKVSSKTPEYHGLPPGIQPLEFYYDTATFRRKTGETAVEVYVGIPLEQVSVEEVQDRSQVRLARTVVLAERKGEEISRSHDELAFVIPKTGTFQKGAFIPDVVSLNVPPGDYRLAVRLADWASGKWGVYLQEVTVPPYRGSLAMSDLEVAWIISPEAQAEKFRKGEVWVVPMPSRSYRREQNVYVYYEVYNLQKDAYDRTRYRVNYAVRRAPRRKAMTLIGGITSAAGWLFSDKKPEVVVGYERTGTDASEPIYIELDTEKLKPGLNQIEVSVTDLNSGDTVSRKAIFALDRGRRD